MALTREALCAYLEGTLGVPSDDLADPEALLFSTGILDSFSMVDLIMFIEGEAGVQLSPADVRLENLDYVHDEFLEIANIADVTIDLSGAQIVEQDNADYSLGFGMSYRPSSDLSCGINYSTRFDRQWKIAYTSQGAVRDLSRRSRHRNLRANANYDPSRATSISASASRSRQRSGTFDSFTLNLTRRV